MIRNKNKYIILLAIVFVLTIGVGFALVSDNLTINGTTTSGDEIALSENYGVIFVQYENIAGSTMKYKYLNTHGNVKTPTTTSSESSVITSYNMVTKGDYVEIGVDLKNVSDEYDSKLTYSLLVDGAIFSTYKNISSNSISVDINEYYRVTIIFESLYLEKYSGDDSQTDNITEVALKVEMIKTPTESIESIINKSISVKIHTEAVEIK